MLELEIIEAFNKRDRENAKIYNQRISNILEQHKQIKDGNIQVVDQALIFYEDQQRQINEVKKRKASFGDLYEPSQQELNNFQFQVYDDLRKRLLEFQPNNLKEHRAHALAWELLSDLPDKIRNNPHAADFYTNIANELGNVLYGLEGLLDSNAQGLYVEIFGQNYRGEEISEQNKEQISNRFASSYAASMFKNGVLDSKTILDGYHGNPPISLSYITALTDNLSNLSTEELSSIQDKLKQQNQNQSQVATYGAASPALYQILGKVLPGNLQQLGGLSADLPKLEFERPKADSEDNTDYQSTQDMEEAFLALMNVLNSTTPEEFKDKFKPKENTKSLPIIANPQPPSQPPHDQEPDDDSTKQKEPDSSNPTKPKYENPGHHDPSKPNYNRTKSKIPKNHKELWENSTLGSDGNRWTKAGKGKKAEYHRFQNDGNGNWHWNGSTNGQTQNGKSRKIDHSKVPIDVKRL